MADISKQLNRIKSAVYGEEVRGSIVDAIKAINDERTAQSIFSDGTGEVVAIDETLDSSLRSLTVYGKSIQIGTDISPTNTKDIYSTGSSSSLNVSTSGKNLFKPTFETRNNASGINFIVNGNGSVTVSGTSSAEVYTPSTSVSSMMTSGKCFVLPAGSYILKAIGTSSVELKLYLIDPDDNTNATKTVTTTDVTFTTEKTLLACGRISIGSSGVSVGTIIYPALYRADDAPSYWVPWNGYSSDIPLTTPLYGVPVTSGYNYTDSEGNHWLCDTIDKISGRYTKNCDIVEFDENCTVTATTGFDGYDTYKIAFPSVNGYAARAGKAFLCTHGHPSDNAELGSALIEQFETNLTLRLCFSASGSSTAESVATALSGMKLIYAVSNPSYTSLTDAQMEAINAVHTVSGYSQIFTPFGNGLKVSAYVGQDKNNIPGLISRVNGIDGEIDDIQRDVDALEGIDQYVKGMYPDNEVEGSLITITDAAPIYAKSVVVNVEPSQSGSGDPSPENIRPITSWTEANVYHGADQMDYETISVTFPTAAGTVYGGTLDLTNGKLTVDRAGIILDGTQNNITVEKSGTDNWYYNYRDTTLPYQFSNTANDICSHYPRTGIANSNTRQGFTAASDWIRIRWGTEDTAENFKTWLSSNPVTVVGYIATPVTYDIDPVSIALLRGYNTLWADCGSMELQYCQDVADIIAEIIKPDETDMTANTTYPKNSFFTIGGKLYKATTTISTGETIVPGSNCTETAISDELTSLTTSSSKFVRFDQTQALTSSQKEQARDNIGAADEDSVVRYDIAQSLTDAQKTQARTNIAAASATEVGDLRSAIINKETSINLYDGNNAQLYEIGKALSSSGAITSNSSYTVVKLYITDHQSEYSVWFPTTARSKWTMKPIRAAGYDADGNIVGSVLVNNQKAAISPTDTSITTLYIHYANSDSSGNVYPSQIMILKNADTTVEVMDFVPYVDTITIKSEKLDEVLCQSTEYASCNKLNLLDTSKILDGYNLNSSGDLSASSGSSVIKIPVNGIDGNNYYLYAPNSNGGSYVRKSTRWVMYDVDGHNLGMVVDNSNQTPGTVISDAAKFLYCYADTAYITAGTAMVLANADVEYFPIYNPIPYEIRKFPATQWTGEVFGVYGDSIGAIVNGSTKDIGWFRYINRDNNVGGLFGRSVGSQKFVWGTNGGSVAFVNSDGSYDSRNDSYNKDNYSGSVPSGTTAIRGAFCSWDRITHMFPASIKDTIDVVFIMGGTNDETDDTTLAWAASDTTDTEWAASDYYSTYGGDYNISSLRGGVASTIMKMQAWMPNATIIIGTPLNGKTGTASSRTPGTIPSEYGKSKAIIEVADMFGCPIIDVYATCGINVLNSPSYITDGTHPYSAAGCMMLGRAVSGGLKSIYPHLS